jgi:hypothetical protein
VSVFPPDLADLAADRLTRLAEDLSLASESLAKGTRLGEVIDELPAHAVRSLQDDRNEAASALERLAEVLVKGGLSRTMVRSQAAQVRAGLDLTVTACTAWAVDLRHFGAATFGPPTTEELTPQRARLSLDLNLPLGAAARWSDLTSEILRQLIQEHSLSALLALTRFYCLPADKEENLDDDVAHQAADVVRDTLSGALAAYVAWGKDPLAVILARQEAHEQLTAPLHVASAGGEQAVAVELRGRLVAAGLREPEVKA